MRPPYLHRVLVHVRTVVFAVVPLCRSPVSAIDTILWEAIADWPLLNAMLAASSKADLVAIHSGGGGYTGYMQSAGITVVADGTHEASERLQLSITNDTSLGVLRYADAGYEASLDEIEQKRIRRVHL